MAEYRLIATDENLERSRQVRRAMKRKKGEPWTRETLALLVEDWRALEKHPGGRMWRLGQLYGTHRSSVHRALERAEREGLMKPGERSGHTH
jgi:hypothetical protein